MQEPHIDEELSDEEEDNSSENRTPQRKNLDFVAVDDQFLGDVDDALEVIADDRKIRINNLEDESVTNDGVYSDKEGKNTAAKDNVNEDAKANYGNPNNRETGRQRYLKKNATADCQRLSKGKIESK